MATRLWTFLNTDIREFFSAETAKTGADSAKAVLELAKALKEQEPKEANLAPYVQQISSLLDVLNRDLTEIETEGLQQILAEAGLCVVQSGGEHAPIKMIEARLKNDHIAKSLLDEARSRLGHKVAATQVDLYKRIFTCGIATLYIASS